MRLDKFLKVSRLIKRRTVANDACDAGRVMINDKPAKASANVKVGDILEIGFDEGGIARDLFAVPAVKVVAAEYGADIVPVDEIGRFGEVGLIAGDVDVFGNGDEIHIPHAVLFKELTVLFGDLEIFADHPKRRRGGLFRVP